MAFIETLTLRAQNPDAQRRFYCDVLGMTELPDGRVRYAETEMAIQFEQARAPYVAERSDLYWKIALSVPDIELAQQQLLAAGVACSTPAQFRDVGYLAKFMDPEGFVIELIDHHFEGARPGTWDAPDPKKLGGGAHLSLLTLRCADIAAVEPGVLNWGMVPLSVQPVTPFGFTLYFYAATQERPPNADLTAVENRTWVYQCPYTVLEIQHVHELEAPTQPTPDAAGYAGVSIRAERETEANSALGIRSVG